jgi:hypothetical protein
MLANRFSRQFARRCFALAIVSTVLVASERTRAARPRASGSRLRPSADAWQARNWGAIRGVTIGPIESALHPGRGYGTAPFSRSVSEARRMGASWISITPFGRVWNLQPSGISLSFEQPFSSNRQAVKRAVAEAHAQGLKVLLVPHLWVESGEWRGEIEPGDEAAWQRWAKAYREFLLTWAKLAREAGVDMLAVGVELRSWVTGTHAASFLRIIRDVRRTYRGLLTYAANWDDVEQTVIWGELDVIGVNAFYPLATQANAGLAELIEGGRTVAQRLKGQAELWRKPIVFTEFGYTTRRDPAVRPWEWPEHLQGVALDELAQADAYRGLLAALLDEPWFAGFFVWRLYADPDDVSQEPEWGFSPRGKLAELVLRDAFRARWASDAVQLQPLALHGAEAPVIGLY